MSRIRLGMVGGGQGAFIGAVHRMAARLDDRFELVAGALSSDRDRALASAAELHIGSDRAYGSFAEMAEQEAARDDGIEVVVIVTPNHLHFEAAKAMLEAGIHVICDKPLVNTVAEAEQLAALVKEKGLLFAVTYNYSGYPMVRQAREMIAAGELGALRLVQVEYPQDWLTTAVEQSGSKQAEWRTDPDRAGAGGSIGDIGSHAFHLAEFVAGLEVTALLADLDSFVAGRKLDDNAHMLLRFERGVKGQLWASQVATGHENGLRIRVYGERGGLEWIQENPNNLQFTPLGGVQQTLTRNGASATGSNSAASRIPAGHPEGFLEGFANLYRDFADLVDARRNGEAARVEDSLVPSVLDGLKGVRFIHAAVASSRDGNVWRDLE